MRYHDRSESFEQFLDQLNSTLAVGFPVLPPPEPTHVFGQIVGLPRSGTTILLQLLARTRALGYPSNVMAPFWRTPAVGARLQRHLASSEPTLSMESVAGRTREPLDPHEFGYFWREALGHSANTLHPDRPGMGWHQLQDTLDAICAAFDLPTVYKNFLVLGHVTQMRRHLVRSRFIVIERNPKDVAASLWTVRQSIGIPDEATFGIDTADNCHGDLLDRIVTQVHTLERYRTVIANQSVSDTISARYSDLCNKPRQVVADVLDFLGADPSSEVLERIPDALPEGRGRESLPTEVRRRLDTEFGADW